MLSVIEEFATILDGITEQDLRREERYLNAVKPTERVIGVVHSGTVRKLWAASRRLKADSDKAEHIAVFDANTDDEATTAERDAVRLAYMADALRELCWIQARLDIGGEAWDKDVQIGIRVDWQVVAFTRNNPFPALAGLMERVGALGGVGGGLALPNMPGFPGLITPPGLDPDGLITPPGLDPDSEGDHGGGGGSEGGGDREDFA